MGFPGAGGVQLLKEFDYVLMNPTLVMYNPPLGLSVRLCLRVVSSSGSLARIDSLAY